MTLRTPLHALAALLSATLPAQTVLNQQTVDLDETAWDATIRVTDPTTGAGLNFEYDAMFPAEDAIAWGFDPANPTMHSIEGVLIALFDGEFSTSNAFRLWIASEDGSTGQPDFVNATGFNVLSPSGAAGPAGYFYEVTLPNPVLVPNTADVFIGVEFLAEPATDLLELYVLAGDSGLGVPTFDIGSGRVGETGHGRNPNGQPIGGYGWVIDLATPAIASLEVQFAIAPLSAQPGFATAATTNQLSLPTSNPPTGRSAGLFSARQPSLAADRLGNARADDPTLLFNDGNLAANTFVGFLFGLPGASPVVLDQLLPGSTGTWCLDFGALDLGTPQLTDANGHAEVALTLPNGTRAQMPAGLIGLDVWFSAIALDFATSRAHAGACVIVRL